ncbi:VOC family protein [Streptomyces sp. BE303]|uniref:VOC family protein n=1 Tax=Streptomyces sp. BE303 TaxID=3002528 RepID=UPI002E770F31|nr:VOC family protein [Streptomyces sp. BE303]MED7952596.1 VOC family protein [Streptomyces sp. BE303]
MPKAGRYRDGVPCWVELGTPDLPRARRFYGALFGWEYVGLPGYTVATLRGAQVAGLVRRPAGEERSWTTYLAVTDVGRAAEEVRTAGGRVVREPFERPEQGWAAVVADPTGAVFGLRQGLLWQGAGLVDEPSAFSWSEQLSPDPATARTFYRRVFGYEYGSGADGGTVFRVGGAMAGGIGGGHGADADQTGRTGRTGRASGSGSGGTGLGAAGPPPVWSVHFGTDDTDRAAERVRELGGEVLAGPHPTPFGRRAAVRDDGGAEFTLIGLPSAEGTLAA